MESLELLKPEQQPTSADISTRNAVNCSTNRISPFPTPNGVSSFSGNVGPPVTPGDISSLAPFMQDAQKAGGSEILKCCETRWLQLFRLVEKQCREQIVAQQKVFYHQIHRIHNEIRRLGKRQKQCACASQSSLIRLTDSFSSLESQMGLKSEIFDEKELFAHPLKTHHAETQPGASAGHQEGPAQRGSVSSGYGTSPAAEPNPSKRNSILTCMEYTKTKGQQGPSPAQEDLAEASTKDQRDHLQTSVECCPVLKEDGADFPAEFGQKIHESQSGEPNCTSLTSWAQKMKENQLKKATVEELDEPGKEPTVCNAAAAQSPYPFYLTQQNRSRNSLVSASSGLTYWKLDEKEMYQTLPETLGNEFSMFPTQASSEQLSSSNELKSSSLKDIYHKKQEETMQLADWKLSPRQSAHPPEILTLDPTLHKRPGERDTGFHLHRSSGSPERVSFSPDSMAEPPFSLPTEGDSFSHPSTATSPPSAASPKYGSCSAALCIDSWDGCAFPRESNVTGSPHPSHGILNMEDEDTLTPPSPPAAQGQILSADVGFPEHSLSVACAGDPVVLSKFRESLREKHTRHITDLQAYYESEIHSLKQQLEASSSSPAKDWKKINQTLTDRCHQLEAALNEAKSHMRSLENKNSSLEMELTDWQERFHAVSKTTWSLQGRIEEMRASGKDKDNTISRLKRRLKDLEEAFEKAYRFSDNKEARLKEENKMFQNLLGEYESLGKEHEKVKDCLNITENRLLDAHTQISDLKRTVSKLETQVKQLEHENVLKFQHLADCHFRTTYASKLASSEVSRRKWLIPGSEFSLFTGQPLEAPGSPCENQLENSALRGHSPPEKDPPPNSLQIKEATKTESRIPETPILKAFKELEERKALKNRGPQAEKVEEEPEVSTKAVVRHPAVAFHETALGAGRSPEKRKEQFRPPRYNSAANQRSSSLPPSSRKTNTPTKRESMLTPVAVTHSPKRSPKENLSPGFSHLLSRNQDTVTRFEILLDEIKASPAPALHYSDPRKRLQFCSQGDTEGPGSSQQQADPSKSRSAKPSSQTGPPGTDSTRGAGGEESAGPSGVRGLSTAAPAPCEAEFQYVSRIKTLAETERFFDELTQEKQQIESQLSRIPSAGGRMTFQARLNQEALEDRLEKVNRELGSIRMILKRFHILRTSANI